MINDKKTTRKRSKNYTKRSKMKNDQETQHYYYFFFFKKQRKTKQKKKHSRAQGRFFSHIRIKNEHTPRPDRRGAQGPPAQRLGGPSSGVPRRTRARLGSSPVFFFFFAPAFFFFFFSSLLSSKMDPNATQPTDRAASGEGTYPG
jgi:hypothetical protein